MDDLYRENILDHYKRPRNFGRPEEFDLDFEDVNLFCGDEQHVYITLGDDGRVSGVSFEGSTNRGNLDADRGARGKTPEEPCACPRNSCSSCSGSTSRRRG